MYRKTKRGIFSYREKIHRAIIFLLFFSSFSGIGLFAFALTDYLGIPTTNARGGPNIITYCIGVISVSFALRATHLIYLKKIDGDWTAKGKDAWRDLIIGAATVALTSTFINYLMPESSLTILIEIIIALIVFIYFFGMNEDRWRSRRNLIRDILNEIGKKIFSEDTMAEQQVDDAVLDMVIEGRDIESITDDEVANKLATSSSVSIDKIIEEVIREKVPTETGIAIKKAILDLIPEGKDFRHVWPPEKLQYYNITEIGRKDRIVEDIVNSVKW